jgi:alkanesulfonate monooxygenase SsuD/methylene tetrahydromethanopterin reductase-like flavin-dependent oxidoreductase (luciferase family)
MRTAPDCPDSAADRYRACIDMVRWADKQPVSVVGFSEHHNTADGFLSSPLMMAMAAASVTERVAINVSALQLPLHDPIRVAEDIVVLDLVSSGRFSTTLGLGYRELEYQTFGVPWKQRGKILDEKTQILLQALRGEAFEYLGTRVQLNPIPTTPVQALVCMGGNSAAAARRAARFALYFAPAIDDPALKQAYDGECEAQGFDNGFVIFPREPSLTLLSENPDRAWAEVGPFLLYDALAYAGWRHKNRRAYAESSAATLEDLRAEGKYAILTPEEAAEKIAVKGSINFSPLCGGVPVESAWKSLNLFADRVVPLLKP